MGRGFLKTELNLFCPRVDTLGYYAITIFQSWDLPPTSLAIIFQVILNHEIYLFLNALPIFSTKMKNEFFFNKKNAFKKYLLGLACFGTENVE